MESPDVRTELELRSEARRLALTYLDGNRMDVVEALKDDARLALWVGFNLVELCGMNDGLRSMNWLAYRIAIANGYEPPPDNVHPDDDEIFKRERDISRAHG